MTIDYVRVNKLKCDCNLQDTISNNTELLNYNYSIKKSLTLNGSVTIPANERVVLRATDGITIEGEFEVPLGSELELHTHQCTE